MKKIKRALALILIVYAISCLFSCGGDTEEKCTSHVYSNDCDNTCNNQGCDHERETEHIFDNDCDRECNTEGCGYTRDSEHVYDNVCDKTCNSCKEKRTVEHVYDNACDEYCNTAGCRETRTVEHVYDDECDAVCNVEGCGNERTVAHIFDHAYDTACNNEACGFVRTVKRQSVLLIGQSNMAGRGDLNEVEPIDDDRILMLKNNQWVKMQEPIHSDKTSAGVGLSASFAKAFVESFDCELGLIPAAVGGTSLNDWEKGGSLYREAVRLARIAMEDSELCAILWHQGEADQNSKEYAKKLKVILDSMLADLGVDKNKIVIITGELFGTRSDAVHRAQLDMLVGYYPNYGVAESDGLTVFDVTTHFDSPSLRVFGYRYFAIFYKCITGATFEFDDNPKNYLKK